MSNHLHWPEQWKAILADISALADSLDALIQDTDEICDDMLDDSTDKLSPSTEAELETALNFQRMAGYQLAVMIMPLLERSQALALWSEDEDYWAFHDVMERFLAVHDLPPGVE